MGVGSWIWWDAVYITCCHGLRISGVNSAKTETGVKLSPNTPSVLSKPEHGSHELIVGTSHQISYKRVHMYIAALAISQLLQA